MWYHVLNFYYSWGSGANAWGDERDEKFTKPNHWDGMLEVVGVTGVVHLGQIQSGLRSAIRIVQVLITYNRVLCHRNKTGTFDKNFEIT